MFPTLNRLEQGLLLHDLLHRSNGIRDVSWIDPDFALMVDACTWLVDLNDFDEVDLAKLRKLDPNRWSVVIFQCLSGEHRDGLAKSLSSYMQRYWSGGAMKNGVENIRAPNKRGRSAADDETRLVEQWRSYGWLWDDDRLERLLNETQRLQAWPQTVSEWLGHTAAGWRYVGGSPEIRQLAEGAEYVATGAEWGSWSLEAAQAWRTRLRQSCCPEAVLQAVLKAIDKIAGDLRSGLSQVEIAREVNLSRSYFSVMFKSVIGKTFSAFERDMRIEKAKKLLADSSFKPIYWISEQAGFRDEGYFSRVFRIETGLPPSEYRRLSVERERHLC